MQAAAGVRRLLNPISTVDRHQYGKLSFQNRMPQHQHCMRGALDTDTEWGTDARAINVQIIFYAPQLFLSLGVGPFSRNISPGQDIYHIMRACVSLPLAEHIRLGVLYTGVQAGLFDCNCGGGAVQPFLHLCELLAGKGFLSLLTLAGFPTCMAGIGLSWVTNATLRRQTIWAGASC